MNVDLWKLIAALGVAATVHAVVVVPAILFRVSKLVREQLVRVEDRIEARLVRMEALLMSRGDTTAPPP